MVKGKRETAATDPASGDPAMTPLHSPRIIEPQRDRGPGSSLRPGRWRPMTLIAWFVTAGVVSAQQADSFKRTDSRKPYSHHLELVDANGQKFDPRSPGAPPFSSHQTCRTCHDVGRIANGLHFNAATVEEPGRAGEPWIWTDRRTGTTLPLSYRGWPGTFHPDEVGLDPHLFLETFGPQLAGGAQAYTGADVDQGRFRLSGDLPIDCLICHSAAGSWSSDRWSKAVANENFAWASAVAMGIAKLDGNVRGLPDDLDPGSKQGRDALPKITYDPARIDVEGHVFFDVVREPRDEACYGCHTVHRVGEDAEPRWTHDGDVHLLAGLACVDCHRNGLDHHTVRGFEGEAHPTGAAVDSLTCRGCHEGTTNGRGGRLGAPKPVHAGLPIIHLQKLSCTTCHSGPLPTERAGRVQTSMAHALGVPSQLRRPGDLPGIVEPVFRRNANGVIEPVRMTWPAYWGYESDGVITPIAPDVAYQTVRKTMRVRSRLRPELEEFEPTPEDRAAVLGAERSETPLEEWTTAEAEAMERHVAARVESAFLERLAKALDGFQEKAPAGATAVALTGGRVYRRNEAGDGVVTGEHPQAEPYAWALGHDVRPARLALGAGGCADCHAPDSPFVHGTVTALGAVPDATPPVITMLELLELDPGTTAAWELSFVGRPLFKGVVTVATVLMALLLLAGAVRGVDGITRRLAGLTGRRDDEGGAR